MELNGLIAKKLEWLQQAHDSNIVQQVATVCRTLGHKIDNNRGVLYYQFIFDNMIFNATWSTCGFNPGIGDFNKEITSWVMVDNHCVCRLAYINEKPDFPMSVHRQDIESDNFIFIPGEWIDILTAKYKIAADIVNKKISEEKAARTAKLAAQLLIEPRVEV